MATRFEYLTSKGIQGEVHGSDTRLNTTSRSSSREYYASRDKGQAYTLFIEDDDAVAGDLVAYLRNNSKTQDLVVHEIVCSSENAATWKVAYGDSTTATGTGVTPVNENKTSSNDADATGVGNGAVGAVAAATFFGGRRNAANTTISFDYKDSLRLGQNDNIVVEYDTGSTGDLEIEIHFYFEDKR